MADLKGAAAPIVGVVALVVFVVFVFYLMGRVSDTEQQWSRLVYLFGGVEAVAFAAAGYFFGKEVNRERADKAEDKAKNAEDKAQEAVAAQSATEATLLNLNTVIDQKRNRRANAPSVSEVLRKFGVQSGIAQRQPEFDAFIEARQEGLGAALPDTDWEELAAVANGFVNQVKALKP